MRPHVDHNAVIAPHELAGDLAHSQDLKAAIRIRRPDDALLLLEVVLHHLCAGERLSRFVDKASLNAGA